MDRSDFFKKAFGFGVCSCFGMGLMSFKNDIKETLVGDDNPGTPVIPLDARQLQNVFCFVDSSMDEPAKKSVFERLGYEHTTDTEFVNWINEHKKDLKSYFDRINCDKDTYWEKISYDPETSEVKIIGKIVDKCACPLAQCPKPPISLCNYCCIGFQKSMFESLFDKPVKVRLDSSFLLGSTRCSSTLFIDGKIPLEKI